MINKDLMKLMRCFPQRFIHYNGEFIAHREANEYFVIHDIVSEIELKYKTLEWLSRAADKGMPFKSNKKNEYFREFMLSGINKFLGTHFDKLEIGIIYQKLGNNVNRELTIKFVKAGYDLEILRKEMDTWK